MLRNRLNDGRWGLTYKAVCLAPAQFSCWWGTDTNSAQLYLLGGKLLDGEQPIDKQLLWIAEGVVNGGLESDLTNGAVNYLTESLFLSHPPAWAQHPKTMVTIGRHVFLTA